MTHPGVKEMRATWARRATQSGRSAIQLRRSVAGCCGEEDAGQQHQIGLVDLAGRGTGAARRDS